MADINATIPLLGPVTQTIQQGLQFIQILVGGIVGLYVIAIILKIVNFRMIHNALKEIREDMKRLESKIDKIRKK